MKAKSFRILTFSIVGFLLALVIAVNVAASIYGDSLIALIGGSEIGEATREAGEVLAEQIVEEGTVLVKNDNETLPLDPQTKKVNVFGWSSTAWIATGSGSGNSTANQKEIGTDFLSALEKAGIEYNTALTDMYENYCSDRNQYAYNTLKGYDYESCLLIEPDLSQYPNVDDLKAYSDTAIVVLSRVSGESTDAPLVQYKYSGSIDNPSNRPADTTRTYLDASTEELALLEYVGANFGKVVVIINATNRMNLDFLDEIQGLDACLVAGGTGDNSTTGLVNVLYGQGMYEGVQRGETSHYQEPVSPSGRLADTYAYDFRTAASWSNTGILGVGKYDDASGLYPIGQSNGNFHDNPKFDQVSYLDYSEDIYVGYKWYETADEMGFWDSQFAKNTFGIQNGYQDVVQYPFGYGLTYTEFKWSVKEKPEIDPSAALTDPYKEYSIVVAVKNVGEFPAQEVVELYYTPPYTPGGIEKSSVNLLAFAKTPIPVQPGEVVDVTLTFTLADMGSYDSQGKVLPDGGWILESGKYDLTLRTDAHNLAVTQNNTFDANKPEDATISFTLPSDIQYYDEMKDTPEYARNLFTGDSAVDYGISLDGSNTGANITYVSRANFEGTFPVVAEGTDRTASTKHRSMDQKLKNTNLYKQSDVEAWEAANRDVAMPTTGANNGLTLFDDTGKVPNDIGKALGSDFYDSTWDTALDQLSVSELKNLALHGYIKEAALPSVGKEQTTSLDGPSQYASFNASFPCVGYPNPSVLAQTWNAELCKSFGLAVGKEANDSKREGWYAPGVNLHRSAFGGRNYEYFSEDSVLSGILGAKVAEGSLDAGVYVYVKHMIGYDQETMRDSLYCWMTEQNLRETYLRPFKIILDKVSHIKMKIDGEEQVINGTVGIMTSYGRIGAVWAGGSQALLKSMLREEWNYNGAILSDYADHKEFMNGDQMVRATGDLWMDGFGDPGTFAFEQNSNAFIAQLREGAHHVLYTICNAAYVNENYNKADDSIPINKEGAANFPLWTIIGVADGVIIAGCIVWVVFAILKKNKAKPVPVDGEETDGNVTEDPSETPAEPVADSPETLAETVKDEPSEAESKADEPPQDGSPE